MEGSSDSGLEGAAEGVEEGEVEGYLRGVTEGNVEDADIFYELDDF